MANSITTAGTGSTSSNHKDWIGAVQDDWQMFSDRKADYVLGGPIGFGASSVVYTAMYYPHPPAPPMPCAVKVLDLDVLPPSSLRLLTRETQLMTLSKHPNVLRVRGTFQEGHRLYIALRLMNSGSVADVMRYKYSGGVEEEVAKCILKQALEGLDYLHVNGFIHRDVKAANLLVDDDGTVLLGDLGVAADLSEDDLPPTPGHTIKGTTVNRDGPKGVAVPRHPAGTVRGLHTGKRKSFVGTPCWMAPEVIAQKHYDAAADIWSLGITALELCQGRAPNSRDPPSKILMKTLQNEPPTLDRANGLNKYSKAFKEIIDSCLIKDPSKRPTAAQLLQTPFFRTAKKKNYLVDALLKGLPPLVKRQERRRQGSIPPRTSMDSWDFSTTITSQITIAGLHSPSSRSGRALSPDGEPHGRHSRGRRSIRSIHSTQSVERLELEEVVSDMDGEADIDDGENNSPSHSLLSSSPADHKLPEPHSPIRPTSPRAISAPVVPSYQPRTNSSRRAATSGTSSSTSSNSDSGAPATPPSSASYSSNSAFSGSGGRLWKKLAKMGGRGSKSSDEREKKKSGSNFGAMLGRTASRGSDLMGNFVDRTTSRRSG